MKQKVWLVGLIVLMVSTSHAASHELLKEPLIQSNTSAWEFELGPRYWYSSARYREDLLGDPTIIVSRLTYEDLSANSAEAFWRLKHQNGVYFKGYVGGGAINGGQLVDEDFPPGITPYSSTVSPQKQGALSYLSIDLGYDLFTMSKGRLGGFVGYHYWQEQVNNFGCTQTANGPVCVAPFANSMNTLNNSAQWNSLRLGINGDVHLGEAWHLETDLAYIHSSLQEYDFHNLRPSIRGLLDTGIGNGFQLDAVLNWLVSPEFSVGLGGRWWYLVTNGWAHFEQIATPGQPQPMNGIQNRYGLLVQANYKFLDTPSSLQDTNQFQWEGIYLGTNIGYATNPSMVDIYPDSAFALSLQENAISPISLNLQNAGFLGGGQLGYNWQLDHIILGIEGDLDYAAIGAANAVTSSQPLTTTLNQNIRWLSSIRGRVGKLASPNMLAYITTGPTWGGVTFAFDQRDPAVICSNGPVCISSTQNSTEMGWTIGGGIEYAVMPHLSFKAEYLYVDLGSLSINPSSTTAFGQTNYILSTDFTENIMRLGLNYKI